MPTTRSVAAGGIASPKREHTTPLKKDQDLGKRLNLNLSTAVYRELSDIAKQRRSSMTDVVRFALGLVKIAFQEASAGHKLIVTTADGKPLKEIVVVP